MIKTTEMENLLGKEVEQHIKRFKAKDISSEFKSESEEPKENSKKTNGPHKKRKMISVRPEDWQILKDYAERNDISITIAVREMVKKLANN